uniref:Lactamase_B domain-containing protein n=1 Tax=Rhabditophanes sp. KR3021 TaxID=114890 RepID=A0AC35TSG3_9BILA
MTSIVVRQIVVGYVRESGNNKTQASGSVTIIESGNRKLLVDCGNPYHSQDLISKLNNLNIVPEQITDIIITHNHIDHCGNLGLFKNSKTRTHFEQFEELEKEMNIKICRLQCCHSNNDTYVVVNNILVAGDLFENENDILDETEWIGQSLNVNHHRLQRLLILEEHNITFIIPGHGIGFSVNDSHLAKLRDDIYRNQDEVQIMLSDTDNTNVLLRDQKNNRWVVINDWKFPNIEDYQKVDFLILTNEAASLDNVNMFTKATIVMQNDIIEPNSLFDNAKNENYKKTKEYKIGASISVSYADGRLSVCVIAKSRESLFIIASKCVHLLQLF